MSPSQDSTNTDSKLGRKVLLVNLTSYKAKSLLKQVKKWLIAQKR